MSPCIGLLQRRVKDKEFFGFIKALQAPIGKPIKTVGLAHHRGAISSRIREVRANLCRILEVRGPAQIAKGRLGMGHLKHAAGQENRCER
jgi:hypothetical protein